jgi:diadenylate cyclase
VAQVVFVVLLAYFVLRRFRFSSGMRLFLSTAAVLLLSWSVASLLGLQIIAGVVVASSILLLAVLIVVYQPELRRAVSEVGSRGFLFLPENRQEFLELLEETVRQLAAKRFGALIAIERGIDLDSHLETGVEMDAKFSLELVMTIFHSRTTLHDGGMIVRDARIRGAACVFPVSQRELLDRSIGLRHRAGIGLTEESDAIAIVVSEETGHISLCHSGRLERDLEMDEFRKRLVELFKRGAEDVDQSEDGKPVSGSSSTRLTESKS